jgi:hypothetical protein
MGMSLLFAPMTAFGCDHAKWHILGQGEQLAIKRHLDPVDICAAIALARGLHVPDRPSSRVGS